MSLAQRSPRSTLYQDLPQSGRKTSVTPVPDRPQMVPSSDSSGRERRRRPEPTGQYVNQHNRNTWNHATPHPGKYENVRPSIEDKPAPPKLPPRQRSDKRKTSYENVAVGRNPKPPLFDHTLNRGTRIYLQVCDITKLEVGAIVNAANERLSHGGGVALAISRAAGSSFQQDSFKYVRENGSLPVAGVSVQCAGFLPCQYVINAFGPIWDMFRNKDECKNELKNTFLNVFNCANQRCRVTSLAVPPISSGILDTICLDISTFKRWVFASKQETHLIIAINCTSN